VFASPLDNSIAELVHAKSIEILGEVGFCVPEADTLRRLGAAGFPVEPDSQMVRVTPDLLETALDRLPRDVVLYNRAGDKPAPFPRNTQNGPKRGTTLERGSCFMGAGTPVNVFDLETGTRRPATRQDVRDLVALQDALPQVDIVRPTVTATDQGETSDLVEIAELLRHTGKPIVHRTLSPERVDAAVEMLAAVAGGEDAFQTQPNFATLYCPISPGYFTPENVRCMLRWAQHGVPITLLSMAMGGASAPATLLGELVVINTDILAWIVALQMVNSGAALMARYYGIPSMCGGLSSDAKELDAQAGFEKAVTAVPLLLEGTSIIYGVGATDAGSTISYLQMVLDDEMIAGLRRMMQGIAVHDLDEEVALIKANTPRGNFLKANHTRRTFRKHWQPGILSRDAYEAWQAQGETIEGICRRKAMDILAEHQPPPLPANVEAEMERVMRRYLGPDFHFDP
jgi:trimethylamine--corrinoid protein Co-methyltransferase